MIDKPSPFPGAALKIVAAHSTFHVAGELRRRDPACHAIDLRNTGALEAHLSDVDVLVISGLWDNRFLSLAPRLRYVQSVSAGVERFDLQAFAERKVLLTNAGGVNAQAVAETAMLLLLALSRQFPRDMSFQVARRWRPMEPDPAKRSGELAGSTLLLIGYGNVGRSIARMAEGFGIKVVAATRTPARHAGEVEVISYDDLPRHFPRADNVILCCPLTRETRNIIDMRALRALPATARIVNVGRGECLDHVALEGALRRGELAGAALDVFTTEPLPCLSTLRDAPNLILTSHVAGETPRYEERLVDILLANLERLRAGRTDLINRIA